MQRQQKRESRRNDNERTPRFDDSGINKIRLDYRPTLPGPDYWKDLQYDPEEFKK
jgi:hypothetical protein